MSDSDRSSSAKPSPAPQTHAKRVLLAVAGGIAAYKSATLCSRLVQSGHDVRVVMSSSATRFIGPPTFAALSGQPVVIDPFDSGHPAGPHISLCEGIDLMIVAPATANSIANIATGAAPDLISTLVLQNESPLLIAPAMSAPMWDKPSVVRNIDQIRHDGVHIVGPDAGWLACRKRGEGRMSEPEAILAEAERLLSER